MAGETPFEEALNSARRSAVHLEMRDVYLPDDPDFAAWRAGQFEPGEQWQWWVGLVRAAVARGVEDSTRARRLRAGNGVHPVRARDHGGPQRRGWGNKSGGYRGGARQTWRCRAATSGSSTTN